MIAYRERARERAEEVHGAGRGADLVRRHGILDRDGGDRIDGSGAPKPMSVSTITTPSGMAGQTASAVMLAIARIPPAIADTL